MGHFGCLHSHSPVAELHADVDIGEYVVRGIGVFVAVLDVALVCSVEAEGVGGEVLGGFIEELALEVGTVGVCLAPEGAPVVGNVPAGEWCGCGPSGVELFAHVALVGGGIESPSVHAYVEVDIGNGISGGVVVAAGECLADFIHFLACDFGYIAGKGYFNLGGETFDVYLNRRLGIFGFLCCEMEVAFVEFCN